MMKRSLGLFSPLSEQYYIKKNANAQFNSLTHEMMAKLFDFKKEMEKKN